ncbi:hypothetical protein P7L78_26575 [Tistrella bauzanensis]|uniref:hypothetical protein n=1 Tax=Tistrella TaxID=171436 RepID=UPI0031F6E4AD
MTDDPAAIIARLEAVEARLAALEAPQPAPPTDPAGLVAAAEREVVALIVGQVGRAWMPTRLRAAVERLLILKGIGT